MANVDKIPHIELQEEIQALIQEFGMTSSIQMIRVLAKSAQRPLNRKQKAQMLTAYIISESQRQFSCEEIGSKIPVSKEFNDARMAAYYMIRKYQKMSHEKMGRPFGQSKRAVIHHYNKCKELLTVPQYYKEFMQRFNALEKSIIHFIAKQA
ncbi:hypothetical protein [Aquimarina pacifica]|uniref:hypothetical protein n=1 Tax=Aquimarina pacifica TaxID=1296415 RepID=UPI000471F925|nr:hypothetical protein [Aquimarina pacifica]